MYTVRMKRRKRDFVWKTQKMTAYEIVQAIHQPSRRYENGKFYDCLELDKNKRLVAIYHSGVFEFYDDETKKDIENAEREYRKKELIDVDAVRFYKTVM